MNKKKIMSICFFMVFLMAVTLGIWNIKYHSVKRDATQEEIDANSVYLPQWSSQRELLSRCMDAGNGFYVSEGLEATLYNCESVEEISMQDGVLHVVYNEVGGGRVGFDYDEQGLEAFWIWNSNDDLFYQNDSGATVTTNYYQSLRQRVK